MKVTDYIKKAIKKYPNVNRTVGVIFKRKDASICDMCAVGFALAGKFDLEKVEEYKKQHGESALHRWFERTFEVDADTVYSINDNYGLAGWDLVLEKLEQKGL